jgi:uncharacterized protein (TIGR01777 family)
MRIFITGGTGFIGRALCKVLLQAGHQLTALSRNPQTVAMKCGAGVEALGSLSGWTPDQRFDAVINLAGEPIIGPRWTERRKQILWDSRITLTGQLLEAIARAEVKPAVLISGSAIGVYGDQGDTVLDEKSPGHDGFGQRLCTAWETSAEQAKALGLRVCILRTGLVIGKQGGFLQKMQLPFKLGLGGRIGDGRQWMSWIHLDDHVAMTMFLLNSPSLAGAFNATAPHPVTNAEFTECLATLLKRPALLPVPAWLLRLGAGEMAELLLGSQRALPKRMQTENFRFAFETLEPALREVLEIG